MARFTQNQIEISAVQYFNTEDSLAKIADFLGCDIAFSYRFPMAGNKRKLIAGNIPNKIDYARIKELREAESKGGRMGATIKDRDIALVHDAKSEKTIMPKFWTGGLGKDANGGISGGDATEGDWLVREGNRLYLLSDNVIKSKYKEIS